MVDNSAGGAVGPLPCRHQPAVSSRGRRGPGCSARGLTTVGMRGGFRSCGGRQAQSLEASAFTATMRLGRPMAQVRPGGLMERPPAARDRCGQDRRQPLPVGDGQASDFDSRRCARYWCTDRMLIPPSPTADATRLTEPSRTSPAANTPGMLVSSKRGGRGCRPSGDAGRQEVLAGENEAALVPFDAAR